MKVLFLSLSSAVKNLENRGIYPDLMNCFAKEGHELFIVCPVERREGIEEFIKIENKVTTLGVSTYNITKSNILEKTLATITIQRKFEKAINKYLSDVQFDLILYTTPPITFNSLISKLKRKHNAKTYLLLKDIFPQNAVDLGLMKKNSVFYKYFADKEKKLYKISDHIGCMSPANVKYIVEHHKINPDKVEVCPNSIEIIPRECSSQEKIEIFQKYQIPLHIPVFLYGGNLGIAQGIDFLIELLEDNQHRKDLFILIVGGGNKFGLLQDWINKNSPNNIKLIHQLNREEYDRMEACCDVGMIFLDKKFTIPNFPSRMLAYLECKLPLLICTDKVSDLGEIAANNDFGLWSVSGDKAGFNKNLDFFIKNKNKRAEMGEKGHRFLKENYDVSVSYNIIMNHKNE